MGYLILGFVVGACLGSFAKALADRSLKQKSFWGRSYCESCKHILSWYDLFPVFSYLLMQGRCRYCSKKISKEYLIVEIIAGILVAYLWFSILSEQTILFIDPFKVTVYLLEVVLKTFFITILTVLFITDIKKMFIPDRVILPAIVIGAVGVSLKVCYEAGYLYYSLASNYVGQFLLPPRSDYFYRHLWLIISDLLGSGFMFLGIGGFFLFLIIITKGKGMGGGDVKLGAFIGLILGYPYSLLAVMISFISGALLAIGLIIMGKKSFGQVIPFGPFLVFGSLVSLFWGKQILDWYLELAY